MRKRLLWAVFVVLFAWGVGAQQANDAAVMRRIIDRLASADELQSLGAEVATTLEIYAEADAMKLASGNDVPQSKKDQMALRLNHLVRTRFLTRPFLDRIVGRWLENLTPAELRALDTFQATPAGQRVIASLLALPRDLKDNVAMELREDIRAIARDVMGGAVSQNLRVDVTVRRMGSIGTAIESYRADSGKLPEAGSMDALRARLVPKYLRELETDAWDQAFAYVRSADGLRYRLISGGSDRTISATSRNVDQKLDKEPTTDPATDLIFTDGDFIRAPLIYMRAR